MSPQKQESNCIFTNCLLQSSLHRHIREKFVTSLSSAYLHTPRLDSTYMSMWLSHICANLYFCNTTGWSCLWGYHSKLSMGQPSNQQISSPLFALLPLLLPSPISQWKKRRRRDKNPSYRTNKARHQAWLALCLRTKPPMHDCDESNDNLEVAYGNGFSDYCFLPFFCLLLLCLTYSSLQSGLLFQPIHETEKCFWLLGIGGFFDVFFLFSFVFLFMCMKTRCKRSLENQTRNCIL